MYLTQDERRILELRAANTGESMAKLLVDAALHPIGDPLAVGGDQGAMQEASAALRDYRLQLFGIARNLNQITRHANMVGEVPADFDSVVDEIGRLCDALTDALASVRP